MYVMRRQKDEAAVMLSVVPGEEDVAVGAGVLDGANRAGNGGRYFSVLMRR